ncbi:peptidase C14, caspase domain-containing protein [Mycena galericulata]|nr:peptidase C14, caspase domain-containing protein [Mycena galericulata]
MVFALSPIGKSEVAIPSSSRLCRESKKKALLIGINSLSTPAADYPLLHGPHQDVAMMKILLVRTYGYREEDIQVLVDDGVPGHVQPDRRNIRFQQLVLTHHLDCGHTIQVPNRTNSEEDGLDECLVPLDGEERVITDNELRANLVDTLPVGASLVSVLDSCHSASLLDLEHTRCNRVFVPWLSKGKRKSDELRRRMVFLVRQLALPSESPTWATKSRTIIQSARTSPTQIRSRRTSIDGIYSPIRSPRRSPLSPLTSTSAGYRNAPWNLPTTPLERIPDDIAVNQSGDRTSYMPRRLSISRSSPVTRRSNIPPPLKLWDLNKENTQASSTSQSSKLGYTAETAVQSAVPSALSSTCTLFESPLEEFCQGWCRIAENDALSGGTKNPSPEMADVISLGSCKDSELSWENEEGISMTRAMIKILDENPRPTLRELVTKISHTLHGLARERHLRANAWRKYQRAHAIKSSGLGSFDTETFQHPQIASHKPLDLDMIWNI